MKTLIPITLLALLLVGWGEAGGWRNEPADGSPPITADQLTIEALEAELNLKLLQIEGMQEIVDSVTDYDNLRAQISGLQNERTSVQIQLGAAYTELNHARTATSNINSALGDVRAFRLTCCGSMEPYLGNNDMAFIQKAPFAYGVGDVVFAENCYENFTVVHRIISEVPGGYIMQGDANPSPDPCVVAHGDVTWKLVGVAKDVWW